MVTDSIGAHPDFAEVAPHMSFAETNRVWFGIRSGAPERVKELALGMRVRCCNCAAVMSPFRARAAPKKRGVPTQNIYLSVSCSQNCSKGLSAKQAIERVEADLLRCLAEIDDDRRTM